MFIVDKPSSPMPPTPASDRNDGRFGNRHIWYTAAHGIGRAQNHCHGSRKTRGWHLPDPGIRVMSVQVPTMLYVDVPTLPEFKALATVRADACVSIYLPSSPLTQDTAASRAQLKALGKTAVDQLDGIDRRRRASIEDHLAELAEDH